MRQIVIPCVAAEGKLQNAHAGKAEVVPQLFNFQK